MENSEDDDELEKRREACKDILREHLTTAAAENGGDEKLAVFTVLFNIRCAFVQHPMDLIGRRMAATAKVMTLEVAKEGKNEKGCCYGCRRRLGNLFKCRWFGMHAEEGENEKGCCYGCRHRLGKLFKCRWFGKLIASIGQFFTLRRVRFLKLAKMIAMGPVLMAVTYSLDVWTDVGVIRSLYDLSSGTNVTRIFHVRGGGGAGERDLVGALVVASRRLGVDPGPYVLEKPCRTMR